MVESVSIWTFMYFVFCSFGIGYFAGRIDQRTKHRESQSKEQPNASE